MTIDDDAPRLIRALFAELPPPDTVWPPADRSKWLRAAASIIDLLYPAPSAEGQNLK